jgi:hypothetical protein
MVHWSPDRTLIVAFAAADLAAQLPGDAETEARVEHSLRAACATVDAVVGVEGRLENWTEDARDMLRWWVAHLRDRKAELTVE